MRLEKRYLKGVACVLLALVLKGPDVCPPKGENRWIQLNNEGLRRLEAKDHQGALRHLHESLRACSESKVVCSGSPYYFLGETYRELGEAEPAIQNYLRALELRRREGENNRRTREARIGLARGYLLARRHDEARAALEPAIQSARAMGDSENLGLALTDVGRIEFDRGAVEAALGPLEEALAIDTKTVGPDHQRVLTTRSYLGLAYLGAGRLTEAIEQLLTTISLARQLGTDIEKVLMARANLALAFALADRLDEAGAEAHAILEDPSLLQGNYGDVAAGSWRTLGLVSLAQGHFSPALDEATKGLQVQRTRSAVTTDLNFVAGASRVRLGQYQAALPFLDTAATGYLVAGDQPSFIETTMLRVEALRTLGRTEETIVLLAALVAALPQAIGPEHYHRVDAPYLLGDAHRSAGRPAEALEQFRKALAASELVTEFNVALPVDIRRMIARLCRDGLRSACP